MKFNLLLLFSYCFLITGYGQKNGPGKSFKDEFGIDSCHFSSTGQNKFFILEPGYQLILEGNEEGKIARLVITVTQETRMIGNIETRVVEENETVGGQTVEISRNFFAYCKSSGDIFYFGEEVDNYKNGKIVNHEGAWTAQGNNKAGLIMPGTPLMGAKYYQEIAPGFAMDRAEIISLTTTIKTPLKNFTNCLKTEETTPLSPREKEYKLYAPGIGLVKEENLVLVKYGYIQ